MEEIKEIAKFLVSIIEPNNVVFLYGDLGSGKSTISYEIIKNIENLKNTAGSPTFTIINEYNSIVHGDLYRLKHAQEFFNTGVLEITGKIFLIEWPQILENTFFKSNWDIHLNFINHDLREIVVIKK